MHSDKRKLIQPHKDRRVGGTSWRLLARPERLDEGQQALRRPMLPTQLLGFRV